MRRRVLILAVLLAAFVLLAGVVYAVTSSQRQIRIALRDAADEWNRAHPDRKLRPLWLDAIGYAETRWKPATNKSGRDGERGGAWGPTQITERTARAYGYTGPVEAFNSDPRLAAQWTAKIMGAGAPHTFADVVGWWNAGVRDADPLDVGLPTALPSRLSTVVTYWPRALLAYGIAAVTAHTLRSSP